MFTNIPEALDSATNFLHHEVYLSHHDTFVYVSHHIGTGPVLALGIPI